MCCGNRRNANRKTNTQLLIAAFKQARAESKLQSTATVMQDSNNEKTLETGVIADEPPSYSSIIEKDESNSADKKSVAPRQTINDTDNTREINNAVSSSSHTGNPIIETQGMSRCATKHALKREGKQEKRQLKKEYKQEKRELKAEKRELKAEHREHKAELRRQRENDKKGGGPAVGSLVTGLARMMK